MTELDLRTIRDMLRHQHDVALTPIETILIAALDRIVEEAAAWGCSESHDFGVDAAAAEAIARIARELDRATAELVRKMEGDR